MCGDRQTLAEETVDEDLARERGSAGGRWKRGFAGATAREVDRGAGAPPAFFGDAEEDGVAIMVPQLAAMRPRYLRNS